MPITGVNITRYQHQPTITHGRVLRNPNAAIVKTKRMVEAAIACTSDGPLAGNGEKGARSTGQNICATYTNGVTSAFFSRHANGKASIAPLCAIRVAAQDAMERQNNG